MRGGLKAHPIPFLVSTFNGVSIAELRGEIVPKHGLRGVGLTLTHE
jgi:hypothetical protein